MSNKCVRIIKTIIVKSWNVTLSITEVKNKIRAMLGRTRGSGHRQLSRWWDDGPGAGWAGLELGWAATMTYEGKILNEYYGIADFLGPRHNNNIRLFSVRISQWRSEEGSWYLIMRQKLWQPPSCPEGSMLQRCSARWAVNSNPICLASADLLWKSASVPATNSTPFWCKSPFLM